MRLYKFILTSVLCSIILFLSSCSYGKLSLKKTTARDYTGQYLICHDYWTAMHLGEYRYADSNEVSPFQKKYASAMKLIQNNRPDSAFTIISEIFDTRVKNDSSYIMHMCKMFLYDYHTADNRFDLADDIICQFRPDKFSNKKVTSDSIKALLLENPQSSIINPAADTITFVKKDDAIPMIEIEINGKKFNFIYDTGAQTTLVSREVAEAVGLEQIGNHSNMTASSNSKMLETYTSIADSISLGGATFRNHLVNVSAEGDFNVTFFFFWTVRKIDGFIGWEIIKEFETEFDFENDRLVLKKAIKKEGIKSNMFWGGSPTVRAYAVNKMPLLFFFDSGANISDFNKLLLSKFSSEDLGSRFKLTWGVGGSVWGWDDTHPGINAIVGGQIIEMADLFLDENNSGIYLFDGTLGTNVANGGKIIIDPLNGIFQIHPPQKKI